MLYLVSCDASRVGEAFFSALFSLGKTLELFHGAILLDTGLTAKEIRIRLLPYVDGCAGFAVVQMYRGHCAGRLSPNQKEFIQKYILPDPALRFSGRTGRNCGQ